MKRLTTDTPKDNFEMALNLFYVKDKEVWVREYGKNGADISLLNLTREILSYQCPYYCEKCGARHKQAVPQKADAAWE